MSLPYLIRFVKSANNSCNFFQTCGASYRVFSTAIQKKSACKFLCPATLNFSNKRAHKFFERACFQQPYYDKCVSKLWCKLPCFSTAFQKGSACKFLCPAKLHFSCKTAHKFFERVYFLQPYYDKRCCEICYLLPKIGNFTKKIAKKYLKPLTVFGD